MVGYCIYLYRGGIWELIMKLSELYLFIYTGRWIRAIRFSFRNLKFEIFQMTLMFFAVCCHVVENHASSVFESFLVIAQSAIHNQYSCLWEVFNREYWAEQLGYAWVDGHLDPLGYTAGTISTAVILALTTVWSLDCVLEKKLNSGK